MTQLASCLVGIAAMVFVCQQSLAGEIYQWRDAAGQVHFTDDPSKVPWEDQENARRQLDDYGINEKVALRNDKDVWEAHCAECHHPGEGKKGKLRGLGSYTLHESTDRFFKKPEQMLPDLRQAIQGETTDMQPMSLDDDQLLAISRFLIQAQINSRAPK